MFSHEKAIKYWETFLQNFKLYNFPALLNEPPTPQNAFQESIIKLDVNIPAIQEFCSQHHVTLGSIFQTAWAIVIGRYAGVEDVSFGYSSDIGTSSMDGEFDRIFICRTQITAERLLFQTMVEMITNFEDALAHRDCSIAEIKTLLGIEMQPLLNSGLHIQSICGEDIDSSLTFGQGMKNVESTEYDILARVLMEDDGSLTVSIHTRTSKFSASQTVNIAHTLGKTLNESIRSHSQSTIRDLDIFSWHDYEQVMSWNKTLPHATDLCFHQHFEDVARKTPDAPAITSWDYNFTYFELDKLSTKLANYLATLGVAPETLVPICFDKSSVAIASMLGILKAGGAFVAIDPLYPVSRIQAIIKATNASIVMAQPAHCHLFEGLAKHIVSINPKLADELPLAPSMAMPQPSPSNTAYVVFTSGSTGAPKGIMVEHRALCTAAFSLAAPMRINATSRFLQFAAYTFDLSYGDIFVTLSQGGCICVPSEHEKVNDLAGAIVRMNVNTACLIPSVARIFQPEDVPCLKTLLLGGEALLQESIELWATKVDLVQLYGPSEATIWCTAQKLQANSHANNIGCGLAALLWITNIGSHDRLCPVGCIGELLIEGPVLARGYLDDQQTKLSFIENPSWAKVESGQRRRFYKTGDLVRYDANGTVRFIGRKDTQVKFHGRRIEMGEIEYHLSSHNLLRQSMVTLPASGIYAQRLVAIVVFKTSQPSKHGVDKLKSVTGVSKETSVSELAKVKDFLSLRVPAYMLPQFWVAVEEIPLMISGKMNRVLGKRFLESLMEEEYPKKMVGQENTNQDLDDPLEIRLRDIWCRILDKNSIDVGVEASFCSLGGDSFSAMELVASCKAEGLAFTVQDILSSTTIRQMASNFELRSRHYVQEASQVQENSVVHKVLEFTPIWWDAQPAVVSFGLRL